MTFRAHFQVCWAACLEGNITVLIKEQAGRKNVQVFPDQTGKDADGD